MVEELLRILKSTPLFENISTEDLTHFAANGNEKKFKKGQMIFESGSPADSVYLVLDGWAKLFRESPDGEESVIAVIAKGETFGEAAVFARSNFYVNCMAVEDCTVLAVPCDAFVQKIHENGEFALKILASISARQKFLVQQIEQLTMKSAPQRLGLFLLKIYATSHTGNYIHLPFDKSLIASRLGIRSETFSRAVRKLKNEGINVKGKDIEIYDLAKLRRFCGLEDSQAFSCYKN